MHEFCYEFLAIMSATSLWLWVGYIYVDLFWYHFILMSMPGLKESDLFLPLLAKYLKILNFNNKSKSLQEYTTYTYFPRTQIPSFQIWIGLGLVIY